jgi:hypothetical protein
VRFVEAKLRFYAKMMCSGDIVENGSKLKTFVNTIWLRREDTAENK